MVVEDDQVVMMDVVVSQVVNLAVYASHHLACRPVVVVVNEKVYENDHHQEESRDSDDNIKIPASEKCNEPFIFSLNVT